MKRLKICLVGNSLSFGGADRIHAVLSGYFDAQGLEVHNVIFIDDVTYPFSGTLLNLGAMRKGGPLDLLRRFRILQRYFEEHHFDYTIDFRNRLKPWQEWLFTRMLYKRPYVITVHSYRTDWYIPGGNGLASSIYKDAHGIVAVSREIEKRVREQYGYDRVTTLYNPLDIDAISALSEEPIGISGPFVLGAGRMVDDNNKQFDRLIGAYAASSLPARGIRLVLLGDGPQKPALEALAARLGIADFVLFPGFTANPYAFMAKAECTLLTSRNEGLPNVITESLACGTPVVAFDCKSGPSELIEDRVNGLLVPDQDFAAFTRGLEEMTENSTLRQHCRAHARPSVERFRLGNIGRQWLDYLQIETA